MLAASQAVKGKAESNKQIKKTTKSEAVSQCISKLIIAIKTDSID